MSLKMMKLFIFIDGENLGILQFSRTYQMTVKVSTKVAFAIIRRQLISL